MYGASAYLQLVKVCHNPHSYKILFLFMQCITETEDAMDSGNMIHRTLPANQNAQKHLQLPQLLLDPTTLKS